MTHTHNLNFLWKFRGSAPCLSPVLGIRSRILYLLGKYLPSSNCTTQNPEPSFYIQYSIRETFMALCLKKKKINQRNYFQSRRTNKNCSCSCDKIIVFFIQAIKCIYSCGNECLLLLWLHREMRINPSS